MPSASATEEPPNFCTMSCLVWRQPRALLRLRCGVHFGMGKLMRAPSLESGVWAKQQNGATA